jgi:hypothetical protein
VHRRRWIRFIAIDPLSRELLEYLQREDLAAANRKPASRLTLGCRTAVER